MSTRTLVVGAGVAGLVSALIARRKGADVTVVEQAPRVGGLWYSQKVQLAGETLEIDHGLRLPLTSGLSDWDKDLFFNSQVDFDWLTFDGFPREAALFDNCLTTESSCFDARLLGKEVNAAGLLAMIAAVSNRPSEDTSAYSTDHQFISAHYGDVYRDHIFAPVLRGFLKRELHELAPGVSRAIIPRRIIATGLAERQRLVSQQPQLDRLLAHSEYDALPRDMPRKFIYPRAGHISCWIDALERHLRDLGVEFILSAGVRQVAQSAPGTATVTLNDGTNLEGNLIVWSLPLVFLAMMRPDLGLKPIVPDFLTLAVTHIKLDRAALIESQYLLNYNSEPKLFRVVFRDNLLNSDSNILTVEQLVHLGRSDEPELENVAVQACVNELRDAGVLSGSTQVCDHSRMLHRNFLPILTPQYAAFNGDLASRLELALPSLTVVGRAGNGALFLDGIILDALSKLEQRFNGSSVETKHAV